MFNWLPALLLLLLQTSTCPEWAGWVAVSRPGVPVVLTLAHQAPKRIASPPAPATVPASRTTAHPVFAPSDDTVSTEDVVRPGAPTRAGPVVA